jgi:hypothetical protein
MASTEEELSDYDVMDFPIFLTKVSNYIDFRIKITLKSPQIFYPGEEKIVPTRLTDFCHAFSYKLPHQRRG